MVEGQENVTWQQWLNLAEASEAAEVDGLFRSDHYQSFHRGLNSGGLDAWATLAAIAARTSRIKLGTLVSPVTFRPVSVLAKCVVTVDHVSEGRAELGIGGGWNEDEHRLYGLPFPPRGERFDELERQLAEIKRQWADETTTIQPKPIQRPHPRIIVGGSAKPRTVSAAVRFADEYNTFAPEIDVARERKAVVDAAAQASGREPLAFSVLMAAVVGFDRVEVEERLSQRRRITEAPVLGVVGSIDAACSFLHAYEKAGVSRVFLQLPRHEDVEMIAAIGQIASELR